jgi:hypothetical protein
VIVIPLRAQETTLVTRSYWLAPCGRTGRASSACRWTIRPLFAYTSCLGWTKSSRANCVEKVTATRVIQILARHRISRFTGQQVVAILRKAPLQLSPGTAEAASEHMLSLLPVYLYSISKFETWDADSRDS